LGRLIDAIANIEVKVKRKPRQPEVSESSESVSHDIIGDSEVVPAKRRPSRPERIAAPVVSNEQLVPVFVQSNAHIGGSGSCLSITVI
jgi:hypothetical protein